MITFFFGKGTAFVQKGELEQEGTSIRDVERTFTFVFQFHDFFDSLVAEIGSENQREAIDTGDLKVPSKYVQGLLIKIITDDLHIKNYVGEVT
ncbi:hypothetical protein OS42_43430 [Dickeya oryzae]